MNSESTNEVKTDKQLRNSYRAIAVVSLAAALLAVTLVAITHNVALARPNADPIGLSTVGDPLPRIQCPPGYTATIYAEGLSSPDGLAFSPGGVLHVAEETAGEVSVISSTGQVTPVLTGLSNPEGIAFDDAGNLYVVEDVQNGRLIKRTPNGATSTLASSLDAPEGVAWANDGTLYVTESNAQFETNPVNLRTRVTAVYSSGMATRIITNTPVVTGAGFAFSVTFWSYAGVAIGPDGLPYVSNELSNQVITQTVGPFVFTLYTTDSLFSVYPVTGTRALFASNLFAPEGLRFSASGDSPLYVAEENIGGGAGRLSRVESNGSHASLCTGFFSIEDVAVDQRGWLYVSEDTTGLVIQIRPIVVFLPIILRQ
jgi:sugar lactone lactonase YvrE